MEYLGIIEYRFLTDLRDANSEAFCSSHAGLFGGYNNSVKNKNIGVSNALKLAFDTPIFYHL